MRGEEISEESIDIRMLNFLVVSIFQVNRKMARMLIYQATYTITQMCGLLHGVIKNSDGDYGLIYFEKVSDVSGGKPEKQEIHL